MIGSGLKKLAKQYEMTVASGVAYGSLNGYATTLSEGSGYKRLVITTRFSEDQQQKLQAAVNEVDTSRKFRVSNMIFGSRWINVVFADTVGTMKKIEEFIQWFYPLLSQVGVSGANVCSECGAEVSAGGWYMVDGTAYHLHESCADAIQREFEQEDHQRKEEDTGAYSTGFLGAFIGAALGAIVWAVVLAAGYLASLVGLLIGWLADKGYNLLHGKQGKGKVAILIVVIIAAVLLGTFAGYIILLSKVFASDNLTFTELVETLILNMQVNPEFSGEVVTNILMGLLFAGLGVFGLLKKAGAQVSSSKIKKLK